MNRAEWTSLPPAVALGLLFDGSQAVQKLVTAADPPRKPLPPKYDLKIYRKAGHVWASETDIEGLRYWHKKACESADGGGQYAEKDAKRRDQLARWVAWREWEPKATWVGTRGDTELRAKSPSSHPELHSRLPTSDTNGAADDNFPDNF